MGFLELNMQFLRTLAEFRTPLLDTLFSLITHLGEETIFMVVAMTVLWCVDKNKGYFLLLVGFSGTVINQMLKITFCIPRPWALDPNFSIVDAARAEATGFSFPSGHTQNAVGTFGALARMVEYRAARAGLIILALLVAFSRLYLGVHTPLDVAVSLVIAAALVLLCYGAVEEAKRRPNYMLHLWMLMIVPSLLFLLYALFMRGGATADFANFDSAVKNASRILGCVLGVILVIAVDEGMLRFETDAVWWAQVIKVVLGLLLVLAVKSGLKAPLYAFFGEGSFVADGIRYFLLVIAAGIVWPLTFHFFSHLGRKGHLQRRGFMLK